METKEKKIIKIPDNIVNLINILAGLVTIVTPIIGYYQLSKKIGPENLEAISFNSAIIIFVGAIGCIFLIYIKLRKYKILLQMARKEASEKYYYFSHDCRNIYFGLQKEYKSHHLSIQQLTQEVEHYLVDSLDYLCDILKSFTNQEICGCVKLIEASGNDNEIDIEHAVVKTFARSKNSDVKRKDNDERRKNVLVKDNTDFYDILGPDRDSNKSYFYKRNLIEYSKQLKKQGRIYRNTTDNWDAYYKSTIVVPIRIANKRLFFTKTDDRYNVIGFLCVDSLSTDAFLENQEKFNCYLVKAFAADIFIILNQYNYYLRKLSKESENKI